MNQVRQDNSSFSHRLGALDAIAVSVAGTAPTLSMSLNPQQPEMHVGRAVPLVFAMATVMVLLVGWCFSRLARSHPNAGSAYGYASSALGPRWGLVTGWALLGTYLAFAIVGVTACGLFGANLAGRFHLAWHPSPMALTIGALAATALLSFYPARSISLILILVEGTSILLMTVMAAVIIWKVTAGSAHVQHVSLGELFVPPPGTGFSALALGMSFGVLSFGGFEQAATLGEEVRGSRGIIPRVLMGTVLSVGCLYVLLSSAEILGFGNSRDGIHRFLSSTSLLADLSSGFFGPWVGDLFDVLAFVSAFGCALAPVLAASRILFALFRDLSPSSAVGTVSAASGTPRRATALLLLVTGVIFLLLAVPFRTAVDQIFFRASTFSALTLLFVYLVMVVSAGRGLLVTKRRFLKPWLAIPSVAGAAMAYTLWVNLVTPAEGAYRVIPWLALGWIAIPAFAALLVPDLSSRVASGLLRSGNPTGDDPESAGHREPVIISPAGR